MFVYKHVASVRIFRTSSSCMYDEINRCHFEAIKTKKINVKFLRKSTTLYLIYTENQYTLYLKYFILQFICVFQLFGCLRTLNSPEESKWAKWRRSENYARLNYIFHSKKCTRPRLKHDASRPQSSDGGKSKLW